MNYDESVFKEKANRKARIIWLIFSILLSANYGSDTGNGLYPVNNYTFLLSVMVFFILLYSARQPRLSLSPTFFL